MAMTLKIFHASCLYVVAIYTQSLNSVRVSANTSPACIRAKINSPRFLSACIGLCWGGGILPRERKTIYHHRPRAKSSSGSPSLRWISKSGKTQGNHSYHSLRGIGQNLGASVVVDTSVLPVAPAVDHPAAARREKMPKSKFRVPCGLSGLNNANAQRPHVLNASDLNARPWP